MFTEHCHEPFPQALRAHLEAAEAFTFVRRSVLVRDANTKAWSVLGCVVKRQGDVQVSPELHEYGDVALVVDLLTGPQCISFVEALSKGGLSIANREVAFKASGSVEVQKQPVRNLWMEEAGSVFTFSQSHSVASPHFPLVKIGSPYFPDPYEAVKHWGALRKHGGATDQTNSKVVVLLPETRGFVQDFSWEEDVLHLVLAGTAVGREELRVVGACWCDDHLEQLRARVTEGRAHLKVASAADRLELFIVSANGTVYEHHLERLGPNPDYSHFLGARSRMAEPSALANAAVAKGEGPDVEYKEWVDPDGPLKGSKLYKLLRTVAAFSNTQGGTIVIGVDDTSEVVGIEEQLRQWSKQDPDEAVAADRYVGALRSRITNSLDLLPDMSFAVTTLRDKLVVILRVAKSQERIGIKDEGVFYVRKSGTNKKLAPNEWPSGAQDKPYGF